CSSARASAEVCALADAKTNGAYNIQIEIERDILDQSQLRKQLMREKEFLFRPFGAWLRSASFTHDFRRGLYSSTASRLRSAGTCFSIIEKWFSRTCWKSRLFKAIPPIRTKLSLSRQERVLRHMEGKKSKMRQPKRKPARSRLTASG